jgi:hypothetical protein
MSSEVEMVVQNLKDTTEKIDEMDPLDPLSLADKILQDNGVPTWRAKWPVYTIKISDLDMYGMHIIQENRDAKYRI